MAQNADSWMVLVDGDERGPATAATVVEAIMGGLSETCAGYLRHPSGDGAVFLPYAARRCS